MESTLGSDLARLVRQWRTRIDDKLKPQGLTQSHWVTLSNIRSLGEAPSQIQLAKTIGIEQPSLVRTLDQLEEKGLIERHICSNDRRAKKISLTDKAKPIIEQADDIIRKMDEEILVDMPQEDVKRLLEVIGILGSNVGKLQAVKNNK